MIVERLLSFIVVGIRDRSNLVDSRRDYLSKRQAGLFRQEGEGERRVFSLLRIINFLTD